MKTNLRCLSPLLVIIAASSLPLLGCRRIATDALDRATEFAFAQGNGGKMDVRVGHLNDDFPKDAPIDPKSDVLTSGRIETDDGAEGWMAAFQTDESAKQVLAFYDSRLHRMDGDAGPAFAQMSAQLNAEGMMTESSGLQSSTAMAGQTTAMTAFELGSQGVLVLRTSQNDGPKIKPGDKSTLFTVFVSNAGRPKG